MTVAELEDMARKQRAFIEKSRANPSSSYYDEELGASIRAADMAELKRLEQRIEAAKAKERGRV